MQVGDIVSETLEEGADWDEADRADQTQRGVVFSKSKGLFHILWFDTQEASSRTDYWSRSNSVRIIDEKK